MSMPSQEKRITYEEKREEKRPPSGMSKLSPALKAAIFAPFARPNTIAAPHGIRDVYRLIEAEAVRRDVGMMAWMTISVCILIPSQLHSTPRMFWPFSPCLNPKLTLTTLFPGRRNHNPQLPRLPARAALALYDVRPRPENSDH